MTRKATIRVITLVIAIAMFVGLVPFSAFASIPNWADENVVYEGTTFGTNGYYNVISKKDYVLVPGAAVESEIVLNNAAGTRRQVLHVIEVDPSNPDVSIVPGYYQIDQLAQDPLNEANWSHQELTEMAKYYENNLGYNIVGGMNTDLYYDTYAPRVLVYNGESIGVKGETSPTSSILYVFQEEDGTVSCDVKAYNKADFNAYLESGRLLHAVGVSFAMTVVDGELVTKTESRAGDAAARSMVGVKEDGTLVLVMNDGRGANNSVGFNNYELGESMLALGCKWAANCDGGGSSTFISKRVGEENFEMRSVPCDGAQRPTAHGIFIASNVAPTGVLDVINVESQYDIFAPKAVYTFDAEAIDTHGYAMEMPDNITWALSDESFGTVADGVFTSNGTKGEVMIQVLADGKVVGSKKITIADPLTFELSATSTVIPYSTADRVRTVALPIVAMCGESNVYYDANNIKVTLSNNAAGTLNGFAFTATDDTSIAGVDINIEYLPTGRVLTLKVEFGKGSEIVWDFENGNKAGFMGFEEAKKWSQDNSVNNTLVGSDPLAGQFNEYLSSKTFVSSATDGGQVRNGEYALAWKLDNTDAAFASWSYNVLFNTNDRVVFRDVENGMLATTLGMWVYIPVGAPGLAFQSQLYGTKDGKTWGCYQDHFMFTSAATGKRTNLNSATEADIPESRWVYMSIDISGYLYLSTMDPNATATNSRSPSFIRTYVKPTAAAELTFYIDDITLDYSSAVDDRVLPTITAPTYSTSDTAVSLDNGTVITGNKVAFSATVADNAALDLTSGKIFVDGIEIASAINGNALSSKGDVALGAGVHTVAFEVKDELGNPMKITRTFTIAGDAVVELNGHNDSGEAAKAQSVYYIDLNVANLAEVDKMVVQLKLHNANKWETKGAVVANGFVATFEYNEISEILTVTIEAVGGAKAEAGAIVSIPVRVWTWDRYDYVNEKELPVDGNMPVVNIECDVVYGEINKVPFGGSINIATELTTISSPYHVHDAQLSVLNKEATTSEAGYENRTYCETCQSVVDWGTIIPKIEIKHNYQIVGDKFVCADEGCGEVYASGTGIFEMNGKLYYSINGVLKTGWQDADGLYCYAGSNFELYIGEKTINGIKYTFDENGATKGAWVVNATGTRYSYGPGYYTRMWVELDGKTYYFGRNSYMYSGTCFIKDNPDTPAYWYIFDENGVLVENAVVADGVYQLNGDYYIVQDGKTASGIHYVDGAYYFGGMGSGFERFWCVAENTTVYVSESETNGLIPAGHYTFGANGKMVINVGPVNGYLYNENGMMLHGWKLHKINDAYYYVASQNKYVTNKSVYLSANDFKEVGLNLPSGYYEFDAEGKLIIPAPKNGPQADGYFYIENEKQLGWMLYEYEGAYYYVAAYNKYITNRSAYLAKSDFAVVGLDLPSGHYEFDENGKLIIP